LVLSQDILQEYINTKKEINMETIIAVAIGFACGVLFGPVVLALLKNLKKSAED
jgi:hypothetical protein